MFGSSALVPAQAAMLSTQQVVNANSISDSRQKVEAFMARSDVRDQLQKWGVSPDQADQRVAALTDSEVQDLASRIDQQPAGGDVIAVVGVVFIVLIILELVGVTHIFNSF